MDAGWRDEEGDIQATDKCAPGEDAPVCFAALPDWVPALLKSSYLAKLQRLNSPPYVDMTTTSAHLHLHLFALYNYHQRRWSFLRLALLS